jgi:hypothetical protein
MKTLLLCLSLPQAADVLRLKAYRFERISKAVSAIMKGFPETTKTR